MTHPDHATQPSQVPAATEPADLPIDPRDTALPAVGAAAVSRPAAAQPVDSNPVPRQAQPAAVAPPAVPTYAAAAAPVTYPTGAYPVSSVPVSAYPVSSYPMNDPSEAYPAAPMSGSKRPIATIVLSAVTGVLVVASGVLGALLVLKSIELSDTRAELTKQVADRDATITLNAREIEGLRNQVQQAKDDLAVTKRDLEGSENAGKELLAAKAAISNCLSRLEEFLAAPSQGKINTLNAACEAADRYR
jgi:hypothetical protein